MELYSVFVTGANRGIGLEFVRQLCGLPRPPRVIFASFRSSHSLQALEEIRISSKECQVKLIQMDVQKQEDVVAARKVVEQAVGENGLTLLINNAGVAEAQAFPGVTEENLVKHFSINTVGPIRVFQEMFPLLQKAASKNASVGGLRVRRAAVLNISSLAGSITRAGVDFIIDLGAPGYKISKAALNMAMRVFAANTKDEGILVVLMCPGWVKTDMGTNHGKSIQKGNGPCGDITPEESISTMLKTLEKLDDSHQGSFMDRFGNPYAF